MCTTEGTTLTSTSAPGSGTPPAAPGAPAFTADSLLGAIYRDAVRELIERQVRVFGLFAREPYVPPTRWQRLRYRLRDLRYRLRHALCCGVCREDSW